MKYSCKSKSSVATSKPKIRTSPKRKPNSPEYCDRLLQYRHFNYEELESATNGFSQKNLLGKGSHGSVYRATIDGGKLVVAVKKTTVVEETSNGGSSYCSGSNYLTMTTNPIDNEIEILSRIRNLGFVNLIGYSVDACERKLVVVEFMAKGSLHEHLHGHRRPPGWSRRVRFALQIAKSIEALHLLEPPVIHRDIKSSNVLIDENWNARLGDFGLAIRGHVRIRSTPPAGTLGYLDPSYITPENLSTKSDVFSYGILLLEMLSGRNAIDVNYSPHSILDWAVPVVKQSKWDSLYDERIGPPKDHFVRRQLALLAERCVRPEPRRRPSMSEVANCLRTLQKRVCSTIWGNLTNVTRISSSVVETKQDIAMGSKHSSGISLRIRRIKGTSVVVDCSSCKSAMGVVNEMKGQRIVKQGV